VDMIVQNVPSVHQAIDISFTVQRNDYKTAIQIMEALSKELGGQGVTGDDKVAKLSIVGVGMRSHTGVAKTMFQALGDEGINIHLITTSEIRLSVVVDEKYLELGARALHSAFGLDVAK
jgi:aspartate kinase